MRILVKGKVYTGFQVFEHGFIVIENGIIQNVGPMTEWRECQDIKTFEFKSNISIIPGMIDLHIHGTAGSDVMDGSLESLETICRTLPQEGTTSFLATTLTEDIPTIHQSLKTSGKFIEKNNTSGKAEILGIHLEGPFISPERAGAQDRNHMINPCLQTFTDFQRLAKNNIRLVTLAPEITGGIELIKHLTEIGVISSIGHSNAASQQVTRAIDAGASQVTHLFNAMRGLHHREPGVVGSALNSHNLLCELIVDGIHVHPEMIDLAYKLKGKDGLVLITDSMRAKGLGDGSFHLGQQQVTVKQGKATLADRTLAGSVLSMNDALKNMLNFTKCSLSDVVQMTSVNPARQLKMFNKGSLEIGKDADLVVLNENLDVVLTICKGEVAFQQLNQEGENDDLCNSTWPNKSK
ncbi:N-acetylglucosamine-6-phosphate deacetylase [Anaerobacillus sp. CMMVII]|uniref:N-acetylglucosamine-6-phosphate deacetylase n=1 Tax=Anaerobacillus sp. CMMVII TaxID=2755588 RepID=UPI0021B71A80|nr:N-acetylglucosamine-6-phosphate deacetylase [Anaerobacillus sp. CMMVII]MCT8138539.1 N-acetylglucosamine-6-phosphate deacetylase [Anaerobacillus sp. CMMVII]